MQYKKKRLHIPKCNQNHSQILTTKGFSKFARNQIAEAKI